MDEDDIMDYAGSFSGSEESIDDKTDLLLGVGDDIDSKAADICEYEVIVFACVNLVFKTTLRFV